jgi:hypothetical protein
VINHEYLIISKMKETSKPSTLAQDYMREEIEKKKKKSISSVEKQARKDEQFSLKQEKRKEKHRGIELKDEYPLRRTHPDLLLAEELIYKPSGLVLQNFA